MLYVRIEVWPYGNQAKAEVIGEATIANDGTGTSAAGNYDAALLKDGTVQWSGRVAGFARRLGAWELLGRVIARAGEMAALDAVVRKARG